MMSLFAVVAIACLSQAPEEKPDKEYAEFACTLAEKAIKPVLKAPGTARFSGLDDLSVGRLPDEIYQPQGRRRVDGWVDSENSFGAKLRMKWYLIVVWDPTQKRMVVTDAIVVDSDGDPQVVKSYDGSLKTLHPKVEIRAGSLSRTRPNHVVEFFSDLASAKFIYSVSAARRGDAGKTLAKRKKLCALPAGSKFEIKDVQADGVWLHIVVIDGDLKGRSGYVHKDAFDPQP
jgi:hypothetical protein